MMICAKHTLNSNNDMILLAAMTAGTVGKLVQCMCYTDEKCQKPNVKVNIMLFGIKGILRKASSV